MKALNDTTRLRLMQATQEAKRPPEGDECAECGEDDWNYSTGYPGSREEPPEAAGRECRWCGNFQPDRSE